MGSLFSKKDKKPVSKVTEQDRAVLQLKQQRDKMKQYMRRLDKSMEKERMVAKQLLHDGKKDKAMLILRKKRYREQLIHRATNQMDNLERMISDIEEAQMQIEVVQSLSIGNDCLKQLHQLMSVEDVERILDETREGVEYQREIDELVSGTLTAEDESEIMQELEDLIGESNKEELPEFPDVPTDKLLEPAREREPKREARQPVLAS